MAYRITRLLFAAFFVFWLLSYWRYYPLTNFLWTCNVAFMLAAAGIFLTPRNTLLASAAFCIVAVPDVLWALDVSVRALTGKHLFGGTEYLFDAAIPLGVRAASFEHLVLPAMLLWTLRRRGYDPRGFLLAAILVPGIYYLTYFVAPPAKHVNWVWGLFATPQTWMPSIWYPALAAGVFVVVFCGLTHLAARRWLPSHPAN